MGWNTVQNFVVNENLAEILHRYRFWEHSVLAATKRFVDVFLLNVACDADNFGLLI